MRSALICCASLLLPGTSLAADALAPPPAFTWLSEARGIARSWSASRDTPTMNLTLFPRAVQTAGGEFALLTWRRPAWTLRPGFAGLIEIESDGETASVNSGPWPSGKGKLLWRGSYAFYAAAALDALGKCICEGCLLEFALQYRHESQHYTGSNAGDAGEDVRDEPYVGDGFIFDAALSERVSDWYFAERAYALWYLPDRSSYSAGAAFDLHARFMLWSLAQPFLSLYGEYRFGTEIGGRDFPDAHRLRGLFGIALPSALGDVMVYGFADTGHRYGIRGLTNESTLGLGVRLALASHPVASKP
jgi:hypothetical protein